jgi:hypothetical protein
VTKEPLRIELQEPIAATVRMPNTKGMIHGIVKAIEVRDGGELWILAGVEIWGRWSTQVRVGEASVEGIAPTAVDMWAPAAAVEADDEQTDRLRALLNAGPAPR